MHGGRRENGGEDMRLHRAPGTGGVKAVSRGCGRRRDRTAA
jgi:hypothetical protein